jgi:hypothetical protein
MPTGSGSGSTYWRGDFVVVCGPRLWSVCGLLMILTVTSPRPPTAGSVRDTAFTPATPSFGSGSAGRRPNATPL